MAVLNKYTFQQSKGKITAQQRKIPLKQDDYKPYVASYVELQQ